MKVELLFLEGIGMSEILLIGLFMLIFFGAKKLPDFMKGLGKGVKEFKNSVRDVQRNIENEEDERKQVQSTARSTAPKSETIPAEPIAKANPTESDVAK